MFKVNENYLKLPGSYLFSETGRRIREFAAAHPGGAIFSRGYPPRPVASKLFPHRSRLCGK